MPGAATALGGAPLGLVGVAHAGAASSPEGSMRLRLRRAWIRNLFEWVLVGLFFMGSGWLLAHLMVRGGSQEGPPWRAGWRAPVLPVSAPQSQAAGRQAQPSQ
jgi:hypothetical protein